MFNNTLQSNSSLAETFGKIAFANHYSQSSSEDKKSNVKYLLRDITNTPHAKVKYQRQNQFQRIDYLNDKVTNLIKSISISCEKSNKKNHSEIFSRKNQRLDRSKIEKLGKSRHDYMRQIKKRTKQEQIKTKKKVVESPEIFVRCTDFKLQSKAQNQKYFYKQNTKDFQQSNEDFDEQSYEQMNEKLKKIAHKIEIYEKKKNPVKVFEKKQSKSKSKSKNVNKQNERKIFQYSNRNTLNEKEITFKKNSYFAQRYNFLAKENEQKHKVKKYQDEPLKSTQKKDLLSWKCTFLKSLIQQIQIDNNFRYNKHMFSGIYCELQSDSDHTLYSRLRKELEKEGISMSLRQVISIFKPKQQEIDPFMSVSTNHEQLVYGLIYAFKESEKYWESQIQNCWTEWELEQAHFTPQNLDRQSKGYIKLEDLTLYINTELDKDYRNRDLQLIFNRFTKNQQDQANFNCIAKKLLTK